MKFLSSIKNIHPAYGAVLLLLAGQLVLGASQRQATDHFNRCVKVSMSARRISEKANGNVWNLPFNAAVRYCGGV